MDNSIVVKKRTRTAGEMLVPDDTPAEKREAVVEELGERIRERRERNYDEEELVTFAEVVDEFSLQDGLVVTSYREDWTEAVITSDGVIRKQGYETTWASVC